MIRAIMNGCHGVMGHVITDIISKDDAIEIVAGVDMNTENYAGYPVFKSLDECPEADVIIDFSTAKAVDGLLDYCETKKVPVVLCTTGLSEDQLNHVKEASKVDAVLRSANMSIGINLLMKTLKEVAPVLAAAGFDIEILEKHNDKFEYKVSWGADLQTEHERYLTEEIYKRPVFVTDYPKEIKAFYMKMNEDGKTVAAVDCLVPGIGEIIGGSQREDDYDKLLARINELGLHEEDYEFYLDLRKYGSARHAGFGLGFERCVMYLTGMSNIRDVIPFPRTVNNCDL